MGHNPRTSSSSLRTIVFAPHLEAPTILYEDNHLLAVSKPAGWHSVPNPTSNQSTLNLNSTSSSSSSSSLSLLFSKCLLSYCQEQGWGGGSQRRFLLPMHRLDQPCTGILLLGKTTKAAQRIQSQWHHVSKTYYCVVHQDNLPRLIQASHEEEEQQQQQRASNRCFTLSGILAAPPPQNNNTDSNRTVRMIPFLSAGPLTNTTSKDQQPRQQPPAPRNYCSLTWRVIKLNSQSSWYNAPVALIQVETNQGRRHMIRALLGQVGSCPILGDLRYGHDLSDHHYHHHCEIKPMPNESVALHAAQLVLPLHLHLGKIPPGFTISAPIPSLWQTWFGFKQPNLLECQ